MCLITKNNNLEINLDKIICLKLFRFSKNINESKKQEKNIYHLTSFFRNGYVYGSISEDQIYGNNIKNIDILIPEVKIKPFVHLYEASTLVECRYVEEGYHSYLINNLEDLKVLSSIFDIILNHHSFLLCLVEIPIGSEYIDGYTSSVFFNKLFKLPSIVSNKLKIIRKVEVNELENVFNNFYNNKKELACV